MAQKAFKRILFMITNLQHERLQAARERDGLALVEHVRRAIDMYLAQIEPREMVHYASASSPNLDPVEPETDYYDVVTSKLARAKTPTLRKPMKVGFR